MKARIQTGALPAVGWSVLFAFLFQKLTHRFKAHRFSLGMDDCVTIRANRNQVSLRIYCVTLSDLMKWYNVMDMNEAVHSLTINQAKIKTANSTRRTMDGDALSSRSRIPSKKWRELIKKVWEADPLLCPHCQNEMRVVALIDQADVIERILRHLGLWDAGVRVESARDPPEPDEPILEPWLEDPFPDYDHEPVYAQN